MPQTLPPTPMLRHEVSGMSDLVRSGYDANDYHDLYRSDEQLDDLEEHLLKNFIAGMPPGSRVLDLGCGSGLPYTRYLVDAGLDVLGVDFSIRQLTRAWGVVPQTQLVLADAMQFALQTGALDGIICMYMLFHTPRERHTSLLARIRTWLKPGGRLLITLGARDMPCDHEQDWCGAPMAWSSYAPEAYQQTLAQMGLKIERDAFEGSPGEEEYHYWVLASKTVPTSQALAKSGPSM